jgi:hypothetical protein
MTVWSVVMFHFSFLHFFAAVILYFPPYILVSHYIDYIFLLSLCILFYTYTIVDVHTSCW